jgi:hypothetical protein
MDGNALPLDLTIYGAIHQHQIRKTKNSSVSPSLIWQGVHTVKFKKVAGPARSPEGRYPLFLPAFILNMELLGREDGLSRSRSASPSLSSLPHDAPHTKILRLLRVLHRVNIAESEYTGRAPFLPETAFVNNKLTAKLTRQLEEPMIVARYVAAAIAHAQITEPDVLAPACRIGLSTCRRTSHSCSPLPLATTSFSQRRSGTHASFSSGRVSKVVGRTTRGETTALHSLVGCSGRRFASRASTFSSQQSKCSRCTGRRLRCSRLSTSKRLAQVLAQRLSSTPSRRVSLRGGTLNSGGMKTQHARVCTYIIRAAFSQRLWRRLQAKTSC